MKNENRGCLDQNVVILKLFALQEESLGGEH